MDQVDKKGGDEEEEGVVLGREEVDQVVVEWVLDLGGRRLLNLVGLFTLCHAEFVESVDIQEPLVEELHLILR